MVATVAYEEGRPSYRGELEQALKGKPQAIALFSYPENGVTIIRQALELGFTGKFLLADGMKAPEVVHNVGCSISKGRMAPRQDRVRGTPKRALLKAYTKQFGEKPPKPYIDNCHDAIAVLALAVHQAKSSEPKAIRDALRQVANPPGEAIEPGDFQHAFDLITGPEDQLPGPQARSTLTTTEMW